METSTDLDSARNQRFFEMAPQPMLAVNAKTLLIVDANKRAVSLLGIDPIAIGTLSLADILAPEDLGRLDAALADGANDPIELQDCTVRMAPGNKPDADLSVRRLPTGGLLLIAINDADARVSLKEQLRQAQKMEALGMLAGGIAHDFNNLLTIISGYSQMLMHSGCLKTGRDRTAVEQILKASERATGLTAQLLSFSRRQTIQQRVLEINAVVDETATMLRRLIGADVDLSIRKARDAGRIHADAGQMQQMLMNLVINAREAMPGGGSIILETRNVTLNGDFIGQQLGMKPGPYVILEVSDTGTGMDEVTRKRAFEPFFTTKPQGSGTGLGLATVYGIVRQCGGAINLYSEPGHGTTFRVYFPRVEDATLNETALSATASRPEPGGHETILLVEDEEGVRKMVKLTLERRGYRVLTAAAGPEALRVSRDYDGAIDLLVSDMIMPKMSGKDLADRLRAERPTLRVLFISGYAGNALQSNGTLGDQAHFLQKPFAPAHLTNRVREVLDADRPHTERAGH